jgi:hypothetical protein
LYEAVTDYVEQSFLSSTRGQGISFARIMPQRQVASCIPAMKEYMRDLVTGSSRARLREWEGDDLGSPDGEDRPLETSKAALRHLITAIEQVGNTDTKFARFLDALKELESEFARNRQPLKILVFSFFKRTLEYLFRRLQACGYDGEVTIIHGDTPPRQRDKEVERFRRSSEMRILLSSEVGSEGLDFQFCNVVFNYDLPWNPMKVEQRIGRLDRLGQKSDKILIYNFSMSGTIDELILQRLYHRIGIFERYIGDLDAILGNEVQNLTLDMFNPSLTTSQKEERIEQTARALEHQMSMMEEFEKESIRFLGQDDYFTEEVSNIGRTRRFISSQEVRLLLEQFLALVPTSTTLRSPKSGAPGVFVLRPDDDFVRFVRHYADGFPGRDEFVRELVSRDGGVPVTFDSQIASDDHSLPFITIHHPLIKAIKRYAAEFDLGIGNVSCLELDDFPAAEGEYMFFIYLLEEASLKHTLKLVPILVRLTDRNVVHVLDEAAEQFVGRIPEARPIEKDISLSDSDVDSCLALADNYMAMYRDDEEQALARKNDTLIDARVDTKARAYHNKIRAVQETLEKVQRSGGPESIIRLHQGRIRNFEDNLRRELEDLETRRGVHVGFSLVAGGLLRVRPKPSA